MTKELSRLLAAMDAATPTPDAARRQENLEQAQQLFDQTQGSTRDARLTSDRRSLFERLISGGSKMLHSFSIRGGLAATTALVAFGLVVFLPQGQRLFQPPQTVSADHERATPMPAPVKTRKSETKLAQRPETTAAEQFGLADIAEVAPPMNADDRALSGGMQGLVAGTTAPAAEASMLFSPESAVRDRTLLEVTDTEAFANEPASALKITAQDPVSTFSIDVDTASYGIVRSSLMAGYLPPVDAVRIEEMINYFPYDYPAPTTNQAPFRPSISVLQTPWNAGTKLVHIALQGRMPEMDERPPLNLVFLIDTSGSMQSQNKLPLLKQSFRLMLGELRDQDQVAIVTYAGSAGQVLAPTSAAERGTIIAALEQLEAGGSTAGQAGLQQAYTLAQKMTEDDEVSRIILATDGDFNVGLSDPEALEKFIADKRESGTYLSVLGFGRGNLDDATMQALAQNGNGTAAYIDTLAEAQKVLVDQLTGALFPIADDVKIQVEFNPLRTAEYRLLGYETRALAREEFNNDKVDAGEIGAGSAVTAIYEITPIGSSAILSDPLRYQSGTESVPSDRAQSDELGFLRLRYKEPGQSQSKLIEAPILLGSNQVGQDAQFSVAVAGFGQLLRGSDYLGDWSWDDAIALAGDAVGADPFGYRREAVSLMRLSKSLAN